MIYLAADHRGFELKEKIKEWLKEWGYQYEDMGAFQYDERDDYPDFVRKAAEAVANDPEHNRGIVLGATGQGEAMVANRYKGVRAAVFYGPSLEKSKLTWFAALGGGAAGVTATASIKLLEKIVKMSREHNNSNILSLGASFLIPGLSKRIIKIWLETPFPGDQRHQRRINKIDNVQ